MTALALSRILWGVIAALVLAGCAATRAINAPIDKVDPRGGYRYETRHQFQGDKRAT
jgi:hypothetical protein